jgi:hypothetical protein
MRVSVHLFQMSLILPLLVGCTTTPVATPHPTTEPISATATVPAASLDVELVAGQWNYLFYHPVLRRIVLVNGGPDRGKPADDPLELWAWDGSQWTLLSADPNGPAWRNFHGVAYDSTRNVLVIFGGLQDAASRMEETWEWDGDTWTRFDVPGPGYREGTVMAYDEERGNVILYGGANEKFEMLGDTWSWDGAQWTQVSTTGPSPRFPSAIVYDPQRKKVLLFSGHLVDGNSAIFYDDFWEWDGTSWKEILVEGTKPDSRNIATMVFYPTNNNVLLFGGGDGAFLSDLWSWDGAQWTHTLESGVPARSGLAAAYDPERDRMVAFGGVDKPGGRAITDTWEWDGETWKCVHGCQ